MADNKDTLIAIGSALALLAALGLIFQQEKEPSGDIKGEFVGDWKAVIE